MAFIGKNSKNGQISASIITLGTKIKGEIHCENDIHINGEFDGSLITSAEVIIGKTGNVTGDIHADRMVVAGQFKGEYRGDSIDILPTGVVFGEIHVRNVIIEPNGLFEGESRIIKDDILKLEVQPQSKSTDE